MALAQGLLVALTAAKVTCLLSGLAPFPTCLLLKALRASVSPHLKFHGLSSMTPNSQLLFQLLALNSITCASQRIYLCKTPT